MTSMSMSDRKDYHMLAENTEMLPCPCCGKSAQIVELKFEGNARVEFYDIACECGLLIGKEEDRRSLLERWNRRV
jgi:Lar family restriction alleviation protein